MAFPERFRPSISKAASPSHLQEKLHICSLPHNVFGREAFNAAIEEGEEADFLNQLHHACC
mgnify:CR=1 FL=1